MSKTNRFLWYVYLLLMGIGIEFELGYIASQDFTLVSGRDLLLNLCLLAAFFVPLTLFVRWLAKQLSASQLLLWASIFGGAFIAGWLGYAGNSILDIINSHFITDPEVFNTWTNALTAPFAEEFFKAVTAFLVIYIFNRKDITSVFIAGLGSGLGFQIIEDLGYVSSATLAGSVSGVGEVLGRISAGFASHTVYTAIVSVGAFLLLSQLTTRKEKLFGLWAVFCTVACHFVHNSPWFETTHRINFVAGIEFAIQIATLVEVYKLVKKRPELKLDAE